MIYTYENALTIRKAYQHLISKYSESASNITDICIIPADLRLLDRFLEYYKEKPAEEALELSGFDRDCVRLVVIHEQTLQHPASMVDLDEYLFQKGIKKTYDPVTRSFVTLN
jgi:hypothetical protein